MLNITMENARVKNNSVASKIVGLSHCGSRELSFCGSRELSHFGRQLKDAIFQMTNIDKHEAIIVKNLTPKVPENNLLLRKVIKATMGGWSK